MQRKKIVNPIIKDTALFLTTAAECGEKMTEVELELYGGGGNGLHIHRRFSETFTAIQGNLLLNLGKKKFMTLAPGEKFTVKPGQPHCFQNPGKEKIVFRIEIVPGDADFERFIHILYKMAATGLTNKKGLPKDLKTLALLMVMGDIHPVGINRLLMPLIKFLSRKAYREGLDQKLIKKYCTEDYFFIHRELLATAL